jgi:putative tricarboxylic transport membrane protein
MRFKTLGTLLIFLSVFCTSQANAAVKAATVANAGELCQSQGKVAAGRAIDGSDLICMKPTIGSSKGQLTWWYPKLQPLRIFELISPIDSRNSDSSAVIASRSADRIGRVIGSVMKKEELLKDFSSKNFSGGSGTWALSTFQAYRNRLATSFVANQSVLNGLITSKSTLKLSDSRALAMLVREYQAIAVSRSSKYQTLDQVISDLLANPKAVTFVGGKLGGVEHVFFARIMNALSLDPKSAVYLPENSGFDVVSKLMSDKNVVGLSASSDFVPQVKAKKIRILGVSSPEKLPWSIAKTLQQQGLNIVYSNWFGLYVPPQFTESETTNLIRLLDVLHNSEEWKKALNENYWSRVFVGQKQFQAEIDLQMTETSAILTQLGF